MYNIYLFIPILALDEEKFNKSEFRKEIEKETARHARLSASHLSTTRSANVAVRPDVNKQTEASKKEKVVSDKNKKLVQTKLATVKGDRMKIGVLPKLAGKRQPTSPLQQESSPKVRNRRVTPTSTPMSASLTEMQYSYDIS